MLGAHGVVGFAEGSTHDDGDTWGGGFTVGVEKLGGGAYGAGLFFFQRGEEAGHIHQGDDGNVEGIAGADEAGGFVGGSLVNRAGENLRLVGDDCDGAAFDAGKTG